MTTATKAARKWEHRGWRIERCLDGVLLIAPPNSRATAVNVKTLAEAKKIVDKRIEASKQALAPLTAAGISTVGDIDKLRNRGESRFEALSRLIGSQLAHELLHVLQTKEKV
jgi:hypothetical protein